MSPAPTHPDSFKCRKTLTVGARTYEYFSLPDAERNGLAGISSLPLSLKVLLENLLRFEDGRSVKADDIRAVAAWLEARTSTREIAYRPARVLMQDFTGVPAVVDLAAMRDAMQALGVTASDTWMIGDNLEWEVVAPQRLGIYAIWIDVHGDGLPEGSSVKPDRIIRSLTELLPAKPARMLTAGDRG